MARYKTHLCKMTINSVRENLNPWSLAKSDVNGPSLRAHFSRAGSISFWLEGPWPTREPIDASSSEKMRIPSLKIVTTWSTCTNKVFLVEVMFLIRLSVAARMILKLCTVDCTCSAIGGTDSPAANMYGLSILSVSHAAVRRPAMDAAPLNGSIGLEMLYYLKVVHMCVSPALFLEWWKPWGFRHGNGTPLSCLSMH